VTQNLKTRKFWVLVSGKTGEFCWHIAYNEAILTLMVIVLNQTYESSL